MRPCDFSDMTPASLAFLEKSFRRAHATKRGGACLEIGTRMGGSALLQLQILHEIYGLNAPMLFTVDPYGYKPYVGGDIGEMEGPRLYGPNEYVAMKRLLASFQNHAHFYMTSRSFLSRVAGHTSYWHLGEGKPFHFSWVLLDGEHAWSSIELELDLLGPHLLPGAFVLVDNVDKDPRTRPGLSTDWIVSYSSDTDQAIVMGRKAT